MNEVEALPIRIALGRQELPLAVLLAMMLLAELAFVFLVCVTARPRELLWWILLSAVIALTWLLWKYCHGGRDWNRTPHLELHGGRIAFVPSRRLRQLGYATKEAPFPEGCWVEYCLETGDYHFAGDHGQSLKASLWVAGPAGGRQELWNSAPRANAKILADNLVNAGIPFRAVTIYDGERGEHTEKDVTYLYTDLPKLGHHLVR
jgi:hypothetical protein